MNILFLIKFFIPFDRGGSEWSTYDLATLLSQKGYKVTIMTLNLGSTPKQTINGVKIIRVPFPIKLKNPKASLAPFWTNNIIWFIYSTFFCFYLSLKNKYQILHVQNNEFIPAAVITSKILRRPVVATFRDYQSICPLGFCLWKTNKACNFKNYLKEDFEFFYENYVEDKKILKYNLLKLAAIRSKIMQKIIYFFAKRVDYKIAVSQKVANIFRVNGIPPSKVIHNPVIVDLKPTKRTNDIIYIGRFSRGKGIDLYFDLIPQIAEALPQAQFKLIGSGYLKDELEKRLPTSLKSKVVFTGQLDHDEVLKITAAAALVVVPSVWPEPLPRSAIEAILSQTPVVATDVGGIEEIIVKDRYGILADPTSESLKAAIIKGFQRKALFAKNIQKDLLVLKRHFSTQTQEEYERIYKGALA